LIYSADQGFDVDHDFLRQMDAPEVWMNPHHAQYHTGRLTVTSKVLKISAAAIVCVAVGRSYSRLHAQEPASTSHSVWDGVFTKGQSTRGAALYAQRCERCHGPSLEGVDEAPALAGPNFLSDWNGLTVGDLFNRIHTTMPADAAGSLSSEVTADILSYVLSSNNFPAGTTELPHQPEILTQIRIDPAKPAKAN
jgi:S-disulfanyl-L-cysteine oxidoreductase SoxD